MDRASNLRLAIHAHIDKGHDQRKDKSEDYDTDPRLVDPIDPEAGEDHQRHTTKVTSLDMEAMYLTVKGV